MENEFTIEDVLEWLGCSKEAGYRVWMASNFYQAMCGTAIKEAKQRIRHKGRYSYLLRPRIDRPCLSEGFTEQSFNIEERCSDLVLDVSKATKQRPPAGSFTNRATFIGYVTTTIEFRVLDLLSLIDIKTGSLGEYASQDSLDRPLRKGSGLTLKEIMEDETVPSELEELEMGDSFPEALARAREIFSLFRQSTMLTHALRERLDFILNASEKYGELCAIAFLQSREDEDLYRSKYKSALAERGVDYKDSTWRRTNMRLIEKWSSFTSTKKGEELLRSLREAAE